MNTHTPRDASGKWESWNTRVQDAESYDVKDVATVAVVSALAVALWEGGKWLYNKLSSSEE